MKRFLILFFTLLLCFTGCSIKKTPDNPFRVRQATIVVPDQDINLEIHYYYNDRGELIQEQQLSDGNPDITWNYEYDEWGNLIQKTTLHADGTVWVTEHDLTLDENHRSIYEEEICDDGSKSIHESTYDKFGNQISIYSRHISAPENESRVNITKSYDKHGNLISETTQWLLVSKSYDENGNRTVDPTQWLEDPHNGGTTTYFYEKNRLVREEHVLPNGRMDFYTEYSYDDTGLIQTAMEYENNFLFSKTVTTFDEYGNPLHQEYYRHSKDLPGGGDDVADKVYTYTYEQINVE